MTTLSKLANFLKLLASAMTIEDGKRTFLDQSKTHTSVTLEIQAGKYPRKVEFVANDGQWVVSIDHTGYGSFKTSKAAWNTAEKRLRFLDDEAAKPAQPQKERDFNQIDINELKRRERMNR